MAPSRGRGKTAVRGRPATARRSARSGVHGYDVPDIYQSMLQEADAQYPDDQVRPLKKRRVAATESVKSVSSPPGALPPTDSRSQYIPKPASQLQTVEASSQSDDSDIEFEDVDFGDVDRNVPEDPEDGIEDLSISIQAESSTRRSAQPRRKPATYAEKAHRLMVHKLHILCLLGHSMYVNGWCSNAAVQQNLRPLLSAKTVSYLNPKADFSQFQRNRSFQDGLKQAVDVFAADFQVTTRGLQRPHWEVEGGPAIDQEYAAAMDRTDFIAAAKDLDGSQDVGNQLFCALLRSVNVKTRLVCSLQTLPFGSVPKASTPKKPVKQRILAMAQDTAPFFERSEDDVGLTGDKISSIRRRLGPPAFSENIPKPPPKRTKPVPKLAFPIYWVEAFNTAHQKWVAVDPIVTHTANQPSKLEPPASYQLNQLTYAIAFEDNGAARDVTKRYAKAFNAKTRRQRVESSHEGARWLRNAMRIFRRATGRLDRDQVEDAELAQKEAREGMPANVLDFKDHPYYALERHLKRHEVIHPKREVGKVNAGTAAKPRIEAVYRRQDLLSCKSSDKWYRCGREIKAGEQPLKHIAKKIRRQRSADDDDEGGNGDVVSTGLYAPHQTQLYVPPPVERGRVPRNAYGNLDIYVPSMVPRGGTHMRHKLTKDAARLLRVDHAEAVTGFSFKGRQGTAIVEGAVVATQFVDAVQAVIDGFEDQVVEDESQARSLEALRLWKSFSIGLRIVARVSGYGDGAENIEADDPSDGSNAVIAPGGFFPGVIGRDEHAMPSAGRFSMADLRRKTNTKRKISDEGCEEEAAALVEAEEEYHSDQHPDEILAIGFIPASHGEGAVSPRPAENSGGGGFPPKSDNGGDSFLIEEDGTDAVSKAAGGGFLLKTEEQSLNVREALLPHTEVRANKKFAAMQEEDLPDNSANSIVQGSQDNKATTSVARSQTPAVEGQSSPLQQGHTANDAEEPSGQDVDGDDVDDKSSLLSHDPDDEDAEPDWLESD